MKLSGLSLFFENKEIITAIMALSIIFFIYWDKKNKDKFPLKDQQTDDFKEKWYDMSQMDIISNRIGIILVLIATLLFIVFKD